MTPKAHYRDLCATEASIPIFSRDWWLDAVCESDWDVCLIEQDRKVLASMPYRIRNKYGLTIIDQPPLTQTLGPWIRPMKAKYTNYLAKEKDLLLGLIDQLPPYSFFRQNWHHRNTNWLPFYWRGFEQTTRYTYRLPELSDLDSIWKEFRQNIRGDIRKAANHSNIHIRTDLGIDEFLPLNALTFERQGKKRPYPEEIVRRIDNACSERKTRQIFIAEDDQGRFHSGVYLIWDEQSAYYLMGGGDPSLRSSGATSLSLWEAIKYAAQVTQSFDFEGSMIKPIERFFRSFGGTLTPYNQILHTPSVLLRLARSLRQ